MPISPSVAWASKSQLDVGELACLKKAHTGNPLSATECGVATPVILSVAYFQYSYFPVSRWDLNSDDGSSYFICAVGQHQFEVL